MEENQNRQKLEKRIEKKLEEGEDDNNYIN